MKLSDVNIDHCAAASALACVVLYAASLKLSQLVSPLLCKSYKRLSRTDRLDWDGRLISTVHSLVLTAASAYLFLFSDAFAEGEGHPPGPALYRTNPVSNAAIGFSVGYFLVDLVYMCQNNCLNGVEMGVHHVAALASVAAAVLRQHAHNYTLAMLASECTTPFVNARWMLDKADMRDSPLYLANGVSLMLVWLLGRIVLFLFFFAHVARHLHQIFELPWTSILLVIAVPLLLFSLNVFWFAKIVKGALKLLLGSPKAKARHAEASPSVDGKEE